MDKATELMMEHSNAGTFHLLDGASHFFMTRLLCEPAPTEARYNQLVEEAWMIFVLPAIQSYHTWVGEIIPTNDVMGEALDQILIDLRLSWTEAMMELKASLLESLA